MSVRKPENPPPRAPSPRNNASIPTIAGQPNPQGKGQVGFLRDWDESSPRNVVAKPAPQLLADYFTSLLVLSASFKFKPAFETDYYLYRDEENWTLSLISPSEWNTRAKDRAFVGRCVLHSDATWSISPSDNLGQPGPVSTALAEFYTQFVGKLNTESPLENELPVYAAMLPYFQRLFAAALSRSLMQSMSAATQTGLASNQWLERIPGDPLRMLAAPKESS